MKGKKGWVCIHRDIIDHWIYQEPEALKVWLTLLIEANHEKKTHMFNGSMITIDRGQLVFGRISFSEKTGITENKIRRYISLFEAEGMINQQKTNKYSVITIANYAQYQDSHQQNTSKAPADHQQTTTPKQLNNKTITTPPSPEAQEDERLARYMFDHIKLIATDTKEPNYKNWTKTLRLMRERDGLTHRRIAEVFAWANGDTFWQTNILSPTSLREQFARLSAKRDAQIQNAMPVIPLSQKLNDRSWAGEAA